jgi:phosphopantetheine adenylyltransferase
LNGRTGAYRVALEFPDRRSRLDPPAIGRLKMVVRAMILCISQIIVNVGNNAQQKYEYQQQRWMDINDSSKGYAVARL